MILKREGGGRDGGQWRQRGMWEFSCSLENIFNTSLFGSTNIGTKSLGFIFLSLQNKAGNHWKMPEFCNVE